MRRNYRFSEKVLSEAFARQSGLCGKCGEEIEYEWDFYRPNAHHVLADQAGKNRLPVDAFIGTVENCVFLCHFCHLASHGWNTRDGGLLPPSLFKYSHGRRFGMHRHWAAGLERKIKRKFGR